jgi:hypothetical protein
VVGNVVVGNVVVGTDALGGEALSLEYTKRFGEPVPASPMTPGVAVLVIHSEICATELFGAISKPSATTPATCGDAIEVPEIVFDAVVDVYHAEVMLDPGANTSTHDP